MKCRKEYDKKYYANNRELLLRNKKQYNIDHKEDIAVQHKQYRIAHRKEYRGYEFKKEYGITVDQYNEMFEKQEGKCAICGKHQIEFKQFLCVDHDHNTGIVRGLLCFKCNVGIGYFNDSVENLKAALKYFKEFANLNFK